jgi:hypothetical protein
MKAWKVLLVPWILASCGGPVEEEELATSSSELLQVIHVKSLVTGDPIRQSVAALERRSQKVIKGVATSGLTPGASVTVLWAIFNDPSACTNGNPVTGAPCGPADLAIEATGASLQLSTTRTVDSHGNLAYLDVLWVGDTSDCLPNFPCRNGLTNPFGAEIHSVIDQGGTSVQGAQWIP